MAGVFHEREAAAGPGIGKRARAFRWTEQIIAALHDRARNAREPLRAAEKLIGLEEELMPDVVRLDERCRREPALADGGQRQPCLTWSELGKCTLVVVPDARRGPVDCAVGIGEPRKIGFKRPRALGLG